MTDEPMPASSRAEEADNPTEDKTRLISLAEAAEMYGFSHAYLRRLAEKKRLKAFKIGRNWVTTPADVEEYIRSREKRGSYRSDIQI
jgi:excisionase family DNA binding protein